eukprot:3343702-Pyramimonas_sp.AAC.1
MPNARSISQGLQRTQVCQDPSGFPVGCAIHAHIEVYLDDVRESMKACDRVEAPESRSPRVFHTPITPAT